ncbi:hypothetical protein [Sporosarcina sp. FA9]|uniref:hypothetical protein n=1 Tax=Sporosarcina sp. FA9 TaxID=3413030 RepID=UPI003F658616
MAIQTKEKCIPGVTQPSHEAMAKVMMFLLETSAPRLAMKDAENRRQKKGAR